MWAHIHAIKSQTLANELKLRATEMYSRAPKTAIYHLKSPKGVFSAAASAFNSQSLPLILYFHSRGNKKKKKTKEKGTSKFELEPKISYDVCIIFLHCILPPFLDKALYTLIVPKKNDYSGFQKCTHSY